MNDDTNPGRLVFGIGLAALLGWFIGIATATPPGVQPSVAAWISGAIILGLTIFIASVVGAYYAGKKR